MLLSEPLLVGEEAGLEVSFVVHFLHGDVLVDGEGGGGAGALTENHEGGFHAEGTEGDVGGGDGAGHEKVAALFLLGEDGAEGDGVRRSDVGADVAFVFEETFGGDIALHVVGIHGVDALADAVFDFGLSFDVMFGDHVLTNHAAGFANVELVGPVAVVDKLILGESPLLEFVLDVLGNAGVVGDKIHEALLVVFVFLDDFAATLVAGFGVVVVHSDVVGAEGAVVVLVRFLVRGVIELAEELGPAGLQDPEENFVLLGVVVFGFGEGDAVIGIVGQAGAEAVGLHAVVSVAIISSRTGVDPGEEPAFGVAGDFVRRNFEAGDIEVMRMIAAALLDSVDGFLIERCSLHARRGSSLQRQP